MARIISVAERVLVDFRGVLLLDTPDVPVRAVVLLGVARRAVARAMVLVRLVAARVRFAAVLRTAVARPVAVLRAVAAFFISRVRDAPARVATLR
ncbi:MAG: hypothetical protein WCA46_08445, partial [Actinocatenispora sp.]